MILDFMDLSRSENFTVCCSTVVMLARPQVGSLCLRKYLKLISSLKSAALTCTKVMVDKKIKVIIIQVYVYLIIAHMFIKGEWLEVHDTAYSGPTGV